MKIRAERQLCQGHGRCNAVAPEVYPLDDDGYVAVDSAEVAPHAEDAARRGVHACPERALSLDQ